MTNSDTLIDDAPIENARFEDVPIEDASMEDATDEERASEDEVEAILDRASGYSDVEVSAVMAVDAIEGDVSFARRWRYWTTGNQCNGA